MRLYRLLLSFALPLMALHLLWGWARGVQSRAGLAERLGGGTAPSPSKAAPPATKASAATDPNAHASTAPHGPLWLHAASNGELTSARPLIDLILAQQGSSLLLTTNTETGRTLAQSWDLPNTMVCLAPLDHRLILRRFLSRHRPSAHVMIENELWPNRIVAMAPRPIFAISARLSEGSARNWSRLGIGPAMMGCFTAVSAQDPASQDRFRALGLPASRLMPPFNLKTTVMARQANDPLDWPRAQTLLAASTHEGEDAPLLAAFTAARRTNPALRLILAPRHPRRADDIAKLITAAGLGYTRRSQRNGTDKPVFLADTLGEMENWYASAGMCFTGGSLVPKGGHTPFEPAAYGCAILHGPHVANAAQPYALLDQAGGAVMVQDADSLSRAIQSLSAARQAKMAKAAARALGTQDASLQLEQICAAIFSAWNSYMARTLR
ncbi:hypothetical protein BFP70_07325 [Thioclava sp. SK-1]|uniref:3-deoxy-D-manno-octulosonic acid transferase n=1 Tax=Thioclava sp. SK-1 TaxID=1889770 RepID=UPI0008268010|nr:glycosyltransferase N-terminal domain-containing protein [Thioclava sp. SK-1]OCX66183.1 hypothetical protein BFP70_07325 [Thioclava sp. SK-1]